jgi:thermitase
MNNVLKQLLISAAVLVLAACSSPAPVQHETDFEVASVATVTITTGDSEAEVAAKYGAKVISFKPEVGFAILGFPKGQLTALNTITNADFFASPEAQAAGTKAWGGGKNAWGGGLKAWGGGKNAWGGGTTGVPVLPSENSSVWTQINLYEAHQLAKKFGTGVKVAVIDSGIDTSHPAFAGSLAPSSEWKDFIDNDGNPQEVGTATDVGYGHGTAVAGLILQVAPGATILPLRVLDKDGSGDLDDVIAAIDWAIQKGAKVINLSLGAMSEGPLYPMLTYAASRNVLVVASAGNSAAYNGITFPARMSSWGGGIYTRLFGVGSVNSSDVVSSFSNYGWALSGFAPGENLATAFPGGQMVAASGTSFAAPLYSGAFALALSENQTLNLQSLFVQFNNGSASRSWNRGVWSRNASSRNITELGMGVIDVNSLVESAYGYGNFVANPWFSGGGLGWWQGTNTAVQWDDTRQGVAVISGRGGFEQTLVGLTPNTTYKYQLEYKLSSATDSLTIEYFVNGIWTERNVQGTAWTKPTLTFTTGSGQTTATIGVWKSSTTGTATLDNFFVAKQ